MESKSLDRVEPELARRCRMVLAIVPQCWISSAYRDAKKQQKLSDDWARALRLFGGTGSAKERRERAMRHGGVPANPPRLSLHCQDPANAVDIGCPSGFQQARKAAFEACGLDTPIPDEPWHVVKRPNWRSPIQTIQLVTHVPSALVESADDMPQPKDKVSELVYPSGGKTVLLRDGSVLNFGTEHMGSMHDIATEHKLAFSEALTLRAVDPSRDDQGYIICATSGSEFKFDPETKKDIERKRGK